MRGEGMPLRDDPATFGDLHVKVGSEVEGTSGESTRNYEGLRT